MVPSRELAMQIVRVAQSLLPDDARGAVQQCIGGANPHRQVRDTERCGVNGGLGGIRLGRRILAQQRIGNTLLFAVQLMEFADIRVVTRVDVYAWDWAGCEVSIGLLMILHISSMLRVSIHHIGSTSGTLDLLVKATEEPRNCFQRIYFTAWTSIR